MNMAKKLLHSFGFRHIQSQLLLLILVLFLAGLIAMAIVYFGMRADASTINVAGRQRMLSQRVIKEALFYQSGLGQLNDVKSSINQFESAMQWLMHGNEAKEISKPATPAIDAQLRRVETLWEAYRDDILFLVEPSRTASVEQQEEIGRLVFQQSTQVLKEMHKAVQMMEAQSNTHVRYNMLLSLALIFTLLLLSVGFYLYVNRFLVKPLVPLRKALQKLAKGDLKVGLPTDRGEDEIGMLYQDYNAVINDFSAILSNVVDSSEQLATSSVQLKNAAAENADGMNKQYEEIEMISTAMNEISATIKEVAASSANASEHTDNAHSEVSRGRETVKGATLIIDELNQQILEVGNTIGVLNDNSLEISKVLDVINGIAEQTNLLALNAAIEAARAGESGRGFAVVADEVRGLAVRTSDSTSEIQQMVEQLQHQAKQSVVAIHSSQEKALAGVEHMHQADAALERIVAAAGAIGEMNSHIANATREESEVANDMSERIVHVAETSDKTRTNAANNRELAEHLLQLGNSLRNATERFSV